MTLFLKFKTESGDERRAKVDGELFIIGRHSESDLCIPDERLSRRHLRIERFEEVYVASDAGSSNGSTLNGMSLLSATAIKHGDVIGLGGLEVVVGFESAASKPAAQTPQSLTPKVETPSARVPDSVLLAMTAGSTPSVVAQSESQTASGSNTTLLLLLIPVFGLVLLIFGAGVIYLLVRQPSASVVKTTDDSDDKYNDSDDTDSKPSSTKDSSKSGSDSDVTPPPTGTNSTTTPSTSTPANTANLGETAKVEQYGGAFLRQIAQNNPRAFLTGEQAKQVSAKVKQLSGSSALVENLKNAQKNSAALKSLAASKNLKPQLLAVAAVAKLGGSRGDVLQTAQGMTEILDKLSTHLGNELADDSLLVIAAYGQGTAGDFMKMRNMLQDLANKSPQSSREIRSIWFLHKVGKISPAEFENALNFLAIGTLAQNPKDFGVNIEALSL